jgi:para-nitrobenzyl esterase
VEQSGIKFATAAGASSLAALRALSAVQIQEATAKAGVRLGTVLDGYFLQKPLAEVFEAGEQAKVPLLAGSNSEEAGGRAILGSTEPTPENFAAAVKKLYGDRADLIIKAYAPKTSEEVLDAAMDLASARFISHGTWKWTELQMKTGGKPVYRYLYAHPRPKFLGNEATPAPASDQKAPAPRGAAHSAEIQYAMGNLDLDKRYAWEPADYKVSEQMQAYFVSFIKTGNPNGAGLPEWPAYSHNEKYLRMRLDVVSKAEPDSSRDRYLALEAAMTKK